MATPRKRNAARLLDPRLTPGQLRLLEAIARLYAATGRAPTTAALLAEVGRTHSDYGNLGATRVLLWRLGYLAAVDARGGRGYVPAPHALARAASAGAMPHGGRPRAHDGAVLAAAGGLVADGRWPSVRELARLVGVSVSTVLSARRRLMAAGRWPDVSDLDPYQTRRAARVLDAARRRQRAAGGTPIGDRTYRERTVYHDRRPA
jgi:hypothetical protein